ncbi:MAG: hypothetical protein IRY99_09305 [Isosphaeraceae bacterium]|nr:hypothetical protein [Isosphaeraceae bacterium]
MHDEAPFPEQQRRIFAYFDGAKRRFGDPLLILRRIKANLEGQDLDALQQQMDHENPDVKLRALGKVLPAFYAAFEVPPLDPDTGEGVPEEQMLALAGRFFSWLDDLKKATGAPPSSSPPTGGAAPTAVAPATTATTSAST